MAAHRPLPHCLYRRLIALTWVLALLVIVVGAYVRLADAGLGCPDWPGCYGKLTPALAAPQITAAHAADPYGPVSMGKAWKEMTHRYLAAALGGLILVIAVLAWRRRAWPGAAPGVASALVGVVIFQGALGMWTVTLLLKPAIVTAHLLGGLLTLALLTWLWLRARQAPTVAVAPALRLLGGAALAVLAAQIALGGWTSTNYAALACVDFPTCHGQWWPADAAFGHAFHVLRELGMTGDGELLPFAALTAIHWSHRVGALITCLIVVPLGGLLLRQPGLRAQGVGLLLALALQVGLGIANVVLSLPLPLAVAHNAGAALLMAMLVWSNVSMRAATVAPVSAPGPLHHSAKESSHAKHADTYA